MKTPPRVERVIALGILSLIAQVGALGQITVGSPNAEVLGHFGHAVSGVQDVNGGGDDVLVGALFEDIGPLPSAGRAYLIDGSTGVLVRTLVSPNPRGLGQFGGSVAGVSDTNGDGRGDLLIGARHDDVPTISSSGRAYLFDGSTGLLLHAFASDNPTTAGQFGCSVAGVPDVDGDGLGDILIGAFQEGIPLLAGRAFLFSGSGGGLLRTLASPNPELGGYFGLTVAGVPDVDGDARGDLLITAHTEEQGTNITGRVYLYSGALPGPPLRTFISPNPDFLEPGFGEATAGLSDINGNGRGDVLIGSPYEIVAGNDSSGRVYLFDGSTGNLIRTLSSSFPEGGVFGYSVSGVADLNYDGREDLIIGAPGEIGGYGRVYIFSGAALGGPPLDILLGLPAPILSGGFGTDVAGFSDADGDGRGDFVVGTPANGSTSAGSGLAYLLHGLPPNSVPDWFRYE